jgi:hypothetical protein
LAILSSASFGRQESSVAAETVLPESFPFQFCPANAPNIFLSRSLCVLVSVKSGFLAVADTRVGKRPEADIWAASNVTNEALIDRALRG